MAELLLVEDNESLARGLIANLEFDGHRVVHCGQGDEVLALVTDHEFDLIILDVMLPGLDGISVLKSLRQQQINTPVLMLTARGEELDKVHALRKGADDYVTKPFGLMELLARVDALLRRSVQSSCLPADQKIGPWLLRRASRQIFKDDVEIPLAPKEYELLLALIERPGQVQSRLSLLRKVWGHNEQVATRTVDTHMAELRRKLEAEPSDPQHLLTARGVGYWLKP